MVSNLLKKEIIKQFFKFCLVGLESAVVYYLVFLLIFYFVLPQMFAYTVAISPISLNVIPGDFFQLTCTAEKVDGEICKQENELYFWAWYFLTSIAFSGIIMKLTKTSMDIG